jgi:hypothetical protein
MTLQQFMAAENGKKVDWDGWYGAQCVDLAQLYNQQVNGVPVGLTGNACDIQFTYPRAYYTFIGNLPWNAPKTGDIVIWKKSATLPYGHIAICINAGHWSLTTFDQNWPLGSGCHAQNHNYLSPAIAGWLRRK